MMYTLERYRKVGFGVACAVLAVAAFYIMLPFWQAIAWGISFAILMAPVNRRLRKKMKEGPAAALTTLITLLFIVGPILLIGFALLGDINHLLSQLRASATQSGGDFTISSVVQNVNRQLAPLAHDYLGISNFDLRETIVKILSPTTLAGSAPQIVSRTIHALLTFVFAALLLFFLLKDGRKLREPALELIPLERSRAEALLHSIYDAVHATFLGVVLISLLNGMILGFAFALLGLPAALLFGIVTGFLSFIPVAGAPMVYLPTAAILAFNGDYARAIAVLCVGSLLISLTIDKIYRSVLIGSRMKLHPMAVFFSLLGGIFTLGAVGMIVGPVILIALLAAIDVFRDIARSEKEKNAA